MNFISNTRLLFWIFQLSGWMLFIVYNLLTTEENISPDKYKYWVLGYIIGFIITIILRLIYKNLFYKTKSILRLIIYAFVGGFIGGLLWHLLNQATYLIFEINNPEIKMIFDWVFKNEILDIIVIKRSFSQAIPLLGWSILYLGIKFGIELSQQKETNQKNLNLLQEARLQLLTQQLNPHFLFNSLNAIEGLVDENKTIAKEMIARLSEYLRFSLKSQESTFVPLKSELNAIKHYLAIMKMRFEEKLEINYKISKEAEEYIVANFILQPIVENAIKYGTKTSEKPLGLKISAEIVETNLHIKVTNTGHWINEESNKENLGSGLKNLQDRLRNLYGNNYSFTIIKEENRVIANLIFHKSY